MGPPGMGAVTLGMPNVLIGGFPMVNIPNPAGPILNALKRAGGPCRGWNSLAPESRGDRSNNRSLVQGPDMPTCRGDHLSGYRRTVGDPIDVVTGRTLTGIVISALRGRFRSTGSAITTARRLTSKEALGWGHTHEYDHRLVLDIDGLRYISPVGPEVGFPPLLTDGDEFANQGIILYRVNAQTFNAYRHGKPNLGFVTRRDGSEALLATRALSRTSRDHTQLRTQRTAGTDLLFPRPVGRGRSGS